MKADYVHKDSRTLEEKPQVFTRWIDPTIEELQQENEVLKKQLEKKYNKTGTLTNEVLYEENTKLINQQKEFIEYMNKTIEELECDNVDDEEMKGYLIQRIDTFKEILSKYKSIIGGKIE